MWKFKEGDKVVIWGIYGDVVNVEGSKVLLRLHNGAQLVAWKYFIKKVR